MIYLVALFLSPLYFLLRGKWGGFILNSIFYCTALFLLITIVGATVAWIPWMIAMVHAVWALRREVAEEDATRLATKIAETMQQPRTPAS